MPDNFKTIINPQKQINTGQYTEINVLGDGNCFFAVWQNI